MDVRAPREPLPAAQFWIAYVALAAAPFLLFSLPRTPESLGLAVATGGLVVVLTLPFYLFGKADREGRRRAVVLSAGALACALAAANLVWRMQL